MSDTDLTASNVPVVRLADRGIVGVSGSDATSFLHNLVSANIERLAPGEASYAALLTPQGKILFDFLVVRDGDGFLLDVAASEAAALAKRLGFYKLRSQVVIADRSGELAVLASPTPEAARFPDGAIRFVDPRLRGLGVRAIVPAAAANAFAADDGSYDAARIALAVPAFGHDFVANDIVPHDINLDDLQAIDFRKGCYVGQEIVSRMKHRGTARRRLVHVAADNGADLPAAQTEILAGHRTIGHMGSSIGPAGLAIVRLDWAKDAIDCAIPITAAGIPLRITLPAYATFAFPETVGET